ncbi:enterobactin exporter EntS [Nocardioides dokdonensis FR1436]|uniref:Enterobactin exporter EntS n=1 Tax=Nocardioides dokdonensis FR1436 TaxID=1300347 RepID=A0A1A9GHI5_9ACTN|nr:MFS transporter [Nocardioides dokdonensis]ANH36935.1 enterobactin exporter EntS [Nocardioides dokdonensis FR1436]
MSPTFRSLSHPNYRRYAAGSLVSNTGTWMQRVAQDWLVLLLTGSGAAIGITTGLQFLPFLLLSPWAGLVADRIPKRRLLQITNVSMAVPALVLGLLAVTGTAQIWHVYVLALVLGVASAFDAPARQSFVSEIVGPDDLANAVGLNSASFNSARLLGPALAGLLIAGFGGGVGGTGWVILLNAASYAAPVLTLRALDVSLLRTPTPSVRGPGQLREGVAYVRGRPDLLLLLGIVFFTGTFGLNFQLTSALMATEVFGKGPAEYGLLGTFLAVGSLTGSLVAARRVRVRHRHVVLAALAFGALEVVAGLAPTYLVFALLSPLLGLAALTMITSATTHLQLSTTPEMRGRVMALYMMIFVGGTPLGAPFIGWVGETFGARWTLLVGGTATLLGTVLTVVLFVGARRVLTGLRAPGSLFPRVWDNQAVARARK